MILLAYSTRALPLFFLFALFIANTQTQTAAHYYKQGLHDMDPNVQIYPLAAQNFVKAIELDSLNADYHYNLDRCNAESWLEN